MEDEIMARKKLSPAERAEYERQRNDRIRQAGTLGGQETARRYGREYMRVIGKAGFQAYADAHHDGNRAKARAALSRMQGRGQKVCPLSAKELRQAREWAENFGIPY